jgi:sodium-dependent dicarboxylate transporter 2/3/5
MRTMHAARESVEVYSPAEEQFNRRRRTVGLFLGPIVLLALFALPLPLAPAGHRMAAILGLVVVFWITEAIPVAVTAVLGPVLAVLFGVTPARNALMPFADPVIFLFIGSFMLAEAMFVHGVDRRIAFTALSWRVVGSSASRILLVYGAIATGLSMWISNTASTAMLFPIGVSIAAHLARGRAADPAFRRFALSLMLMTSFGASIGGMATPVGTPPNLIGIGLMERLAGVRISFFAWMAVAIPAVLVLFAFISAYFHVLGARGLPIAAGSAEIVQEELRKLGGTTIGQRNVLVAFGVTVVLWIAPGVLALAAPDSPLTPAFAALVPEAIAAMIGAILLFLLPINWRARRFTLTWEEAARIDWGTVLLFGGGMAMGELAFSTGLAEAMGKGLSSWLPWHGGLALTVLFTGFAILLSETTSNTASATMILPIAIAVSEAAGVRPIEPALGATLGASMGFMMPISTPPNAIVYSSGYVPITSMMRHGLVLDIASFLVVVSVVWVMGPLVF